MSSMMTSRPPALDDATYLVDAIFPLGHDAVRLRRAAGAGVPAGPLARPARPPLLRQAADDDADRGRAPAPRLGPPRPGRGERAGHGPDAHRAWAGSRPA